MFKIKTIFFLTLLFLCVNLYPQQSKPSEEGKNKFVVGKIKFTGIKATKPNYLLSVIPIKEGSVWNEDVKKELILKLLDIKAIVEEVKINEEKKENNVVDITIDILEKYPFLVVPYATYSNSNGLQPKLIFRDYNLFGEKKYFNAKAQFMPKQDFDISAKYFDPAVSNNPRLNYEIDGFFGFSALNFYTNLDSNGLIKGIGPFLVPGGYTDRTWNDENYIEGSISSTLSYKIPGNDIEIRPSISIDYKRIISKCYVDSTISGILDGNITYGHADTDTYITHNQVDKINPSFGLSVYIPVKSIFAVIVPSYNFNYQYIIGDENLGDSTVFINRYGRNIYDNLGSNARVDFNFLIPVVLINLTPYLSFSLTKNGAYHYNNSSFSLDSFQSDNTPTVDIDLIFGINFSKSFTVKQFKHSFKLNAEFDERVYGDTEVSYKYLANDNLLNSGVSKVVHNNSDFDTNDVDYFDNFYNKYLKFKFEFNYEMDFNVYKDHHFLMGYFVFYSYNQNAYFNNYSAGINQVAAYSATLRDEIMSGFVGAICNLKYQLPLFFIDTTKFVTMKVKKPLRWDIFWDFNVDVGLVENDSIIEDGDFIYSLSPAVGRHLNLYPLLGAATAIRILPRFSPLEIALQIGGDVYKIFKTKTVSGSTIYFSLSIEDKF